jgi:hypothetical protein
MTGHLAETLQLQNCERAGVPARAARLGWRMRPDHFSFSFDMFHFLLCTAGKMKNQASLIHTRFQPGDGAARLLFTSTFLTVSREDETVKTAMTYLTHLSHVW